MVEQATQPAPAPEPAPQPAPTEATPPTGVADPDVPAYVAELEQLAKLKDQGVLSEAEFDAKKRQILGLD